MSHRTVAAFLSITAAAFAQDFRATLQGTVTDPSNAAIANASVTARHVETGVERTAQTNDAGYYLVQYLPLGMYTLTVQAPGFRTLKRDNIQLSVGANVRMDVA